MVKAATGTEPVTSAHASAPSSATIRAASGADSVSFQSFAGRRARPRWSSRTIPCCCPATEIAATSGAPAAATAWASPSHHASGSCSLHGGCATGCGARPEATNAPESASRTSTFVAWVELSTPMTRGIA